MTTKNKFLTLGSIVVFATAFILAEYKIHLQQKELDTLHLDNRQIHYLEQKVDSLTSESFTQDIQIHRYEYILDEINSSPDVSRKSKKAIDNILSNTE